MPRGHARFCSERRVLFCASPLERLRHALARKIEEVALWRPQPGGALEGTPNKFVRGGDPRAVRVGGAEGAAAYVHVLAAAPSEGDEAVLKRAHKGYKMEQATLALQPGLYEAELNLGLSLMRTNDPAELASAIFE